MPALAMIAGAAAGWLAEQRLVAILAECSSSVYLATSSRQ